MVKGSDVALIYALPTVLLLACAIGLINGLGIVFLGLSPIVMTLATNGLLQGAALLRDSSKKRPVWEDFKEIARCYKQITGGG